MKSVRNHNKGPATDVVPRLLKQLLLFLLVVLISSLFFLLNAFFPFFTLLSFALSTRQGLKLLWIGNCKSVVQLVTKKSNLSGVDPLYDWETYLCRYLLASFVEFLALVAPAIVWDSGSVRTVLGSQENAWGDSIDEVGSDKESMTVLTSELKGVLALTNTEGFWQTLSTKNLGYELGLFKYGHFTVRILSCFLWQKVGGEVRLGI